MTAFAASWAVLEGALALRLQQRYDLTQIVWCRYATHLAIVFALWGRRHPRLWRTERPVYHLSRSLLMLAMPAGFALALYSGASVRTVESAMWIAPVLILALSRLVLGEKPTIFAALAAIAGSVAAVLIIEPPVVLPLRAALWVSVMAGSFALYVVMTRRLRDEPVWTNLFYTAAGVFVLLTLHMPSVWIMPSAHDAVVLAGIGGLGFLGLLALDRATERASVATTASFLQTEIVFAALIVWLRHPGLVPAHVVRGAALIIGAAMVRWHQVGGARGASEAG